MESEWKGKRLRASISYKVSSEALEPGTSQFGLIIKPISLI